MQSILKIGGTTGGADPKLECANLLKRYQLPSCLRLARMSSLYLESHSILTNSSITLWARNCHKFVHGYTDMEFLNLNL
jgi:hypothetical protein